MTNGLNQIAFDTDVKRALAPDVLDERTKDPFPTTPSEDKLANYSSDAQITMTIARGNTKNLIQKEIDWINGEHTEAEVQTKHCKYFL